MKVEKSQKTILKWDSKKFGLCGATLWDGKCASFSFFEIGESNDTGIQSYNIEYLIELHKVLGELIDYCKEQG